MKKYIEIRDSIEESLPRQVILHTKYVYDLAIEIYLDSKYNISEFLELIERYIFEHLNIANKTNIYDSCDIYFDNKNYRRMSGPGTYEICFMINHSILSKEKLKQINCLFEDLDLDFVL